MTSTHPTLDELLALREPGTEPGTAAVRAHLEGCPACAEEFRRLEQRVARLRALPTLRPARSAWPEVQGQVRALHRRRRLRVAAVASVGLAASLLVGVVVRDLARPAQLDASTELSSVMSQSQLLEEAIRTWNPEARVTDGYTARVAGELEQRIAQLDQALEATQLGQAPAAGHQERVLELWRERVGLLDALVDVHLTGASDVGL